MTFKERQWLRITLLKQLYDYYFEHGRSFQISLKELNDNIENKLAYQYLTDKHWISMTGNSGTLYSLKITALGIDQVESLG